MSLNDVDQQIRGLFTPVQNMTTLVNSASQNVTGVLNTTNTVQSNINNLMNTIQPLTNLSNCDLPICNVLNTVNNLANCTDPLCKSLKSTKDMIVSGEIPENCASNDYFCNMVKDISGLGNLSCSTQPNNFICRIMSTLQSAITNFITGLIGQYQSIIFGTVLTVFIVFFLMFLMIVYILVIKPFVSKG